MRTLKTLSSASLAAALLALSAVPASGQKKYQPSYSEEGDAKLLAQFQNDPDHRIHMAKAKAGDPYAMLKMERAAEVYLDSNLFDKMKATEMRMKLLVAAMQKNYPAAYGRMGDLIVQDGAIPGATHLDGFEYYIQGVKLKDTASIVQASKLAKSPFICTGCSKSSAGKLVLEMPKGKLFDIDEMNKAGVRFIVEKTKMATELVAALEAVYEPKKDLASTTLIGIYLSGIEMPASGYYKQKDRALIRPNAKKAEANLQAIAAADA